MMKRTAIFLLSLLVAVFGTAMDLHAGEISSLGIRLENYAYPFPVSIFKFESQNQDLEMAYMDVEPEIPNDETVINPKRVASIPPIEWPRIWDFSTPISLSKAAVFVARSWKV